MNKHVKHAAWVLEHSNCLKKKAYLFLLNKWHVAQIKTTSLHISPTASWYESPRKTQHSSPLDGTMMYSHSKRQGQMGSNNGHWVPRASRRLLKLLEGHWLACTPPMPKNRGPVPFLHGTNLAVGLTRCHMMHMLKRNKEYTMILQKKKVFSRRVVSPVQAVRILSLSKEVFQTQDPFLFCQLGINRLCT